MAPSTKAMLAALGLSCAFWAPGLGQQVTGGWRHASVLTATDNCDACHTPHALSDGSRTLKGDAGGGRVQAWLEVQAPGAGSSSIVCLRCHWTSQGRSLLPELALQPASGGHFVGPDLADDHPLGSTDPTTPRLRDGRASSLQRSLVIRDRDAVECTTCHDPHTPGAAVPSGAELRRLCGSCHVTEAAALDRHRAVSCTGCHELHDSRQAPLLRETTVEFTCNRCHAGAGTPLAKQPEQRPGDEIPLTFTPAHYPGSNCRQCHTIHRGF